MKLLYAVRGDRAASGSGLLSTTGWMAPESMSAEISRNWLPFAFMKRNEKLTPRRLALFLMLELNRRMINFMNHEAPGTS